MAYKKIVAVLTGADADAATLAGAFAAASPFEGHVEALFVWPDPTQAVPFIGMPVAPEVVQQIIDSGEAIANAAHAQARQHLTAAAERAGATLVDQPAAGSGLRCSFRKIPGRFIDQVVDAARLADLVVFGPDITETGPDVSGAFIETLTETGRPVLLAPDKPVSDLLRKIVIGWDDSLPAAHALSAALPFLKQAGEVALYSVRGVPADSSRLDEPVAYLALHGVTAATRVIDPKGEAPGAVLLSQAEGAGVSMLVLGGYGHSRLMETLFGGATMHIAGHAALPLFMMH